MKNLVLIGMAGAAKTTTGRTVAKKLNRPFFDSDEVYVSLHGEKISETFEKSGEEEFRRRESAICEILGNLDGAVIACGGGVVLREENMTALKRNGIVALLTATPEAIFARVSRNDNRPLLKSGGIERVREILTEREPLYRRYADFVVDNSHCSVRSAADRVIAFFNRLVKN